MGASTNIAVSGIQCSGNVHLGNYIGAIQQCIRLQESHHCYFFIADLHALTKPQDPQRIQQQTLEAAAIYLAAGIDPQKATLFIQSHVPEHTELGWILNTITPLGELERMTQFKYKSQKQSSANILAGLLNYPTLMAADILLYQANTVPVGEDQVQHLELTRTLARKFNSRFGKTFVEPKPLTQKIGARIMGLDDPTKKMSKSASSKNNYIGLLDSEEEIRRKVKIAVTDSGKEITYDPNTKPAIANLLTMYAALDGRQIGEIERQYVKKGYAEFKSDLANVLARTLKPIQKRHQELLKNPDALRATLRDGAMRAQQVAARTMREVKEKIGLVL